MAKERHSKDASSAPNVQFSTYFSSNVRNKKDTGTNLRTENRTSQPQQNMPLDICWRFKYLIRIQNNKYYDLLVNIRKFVFMETITAVLPRRR